MRPSATPNASPRAEKPSRPANSSQIDTLFVNPRPDRQIKYFTAYDPVAKWTIGHVATASAARNRLDKLIESAPFTVKGI
jgi:putative transposase